MAQTSKSFFEVLEDQIRTDLRREIEAEVRAEQERHANLQQRVRAEAEAGRLATWLATHTGAFSFARRSPYAANTVKRGATQETASLADSPAGSLAIPPVAPPTMAPKEPTVVLTTVEDLCALELIARNGGKKLATTLTESELKAAWRRAALKTHPDRFTGSDTLVQMRQAALFREIASAYETLSRHFICHAA